MDAPLLGNYGVTLQPGEKKTLYKRFEQTPEAQAVYLVLTWCEGGEKISRYFLLEERAIYPTLENGSRGEDVTALQARLIELGYLDDDATASLAPTPRAPCAPPARAAGLDDSGLADDDFSSPSSARISPRRNRGTNRLACGRAGFLCLGRTGAYHLGAPFHALKAVFAVEAIGRGVAAGEQRHRRRAFRVRCRRGDSPRAGALPRGRRSARRAARAKRRRRVCGKTRRRRHWNRTNRPPWRAG